MRIVHAADIHLDSPLKGLREIEDSRRDEIRLATRRAFTRLIDLCIEEQAALLLLAGDLFDQEQKDFHTGLFAARELARLRESKTAIVLTRGNHDAASNIHKVLRDASNLDIKVLDHQKPESKLFSTFNVAVHGQSFATTHVRENLVARFPAPINGMVNIGLVHADVGGNGNGEYAYAPCTLLDLVQSGYDYWALGHSHNRDVLSTEPHIVYPGNLQGRHVQETGSKGCTLIHLEDGSISKIEYRPCNVVEWAHLYVDASRYNTRDQVLDAVSQKMEQCRKSSAVADHPIIARVTVSGASPAHHALVANAADFKACVAGSAADWQIWMEQTKMDTKASPAVTPSTASPKLLQALQDEFQQLREQPDTLMDYLSELQPLQQLVSGCNLEALPLDRESGHTLRLMEQAAALLQARLCSVSEGTID